MSFQCLQCIQPDFKGMHTCHLNPDGAASSQSRGFGSPPAPQDDTESVMLSPWSFEKLPPEPKSKGGRPIGFDGTKSKQPSALAQAFKKAGLDWKEDFALAIKGNKRERIKLWLKLLPYMITTSKRTKVARWKGKPSRAAKIALEAMERDLR